MSMSSLKHPGTILGIVDLIAIVGVGVYFNRRVSAIEEAFDKLSKKVEEIGLVTVELTTFKKVVEETLKKQMVKSSRTNQSLIEALDKLDELEEQLATINEALKNSEIKIELKPPAKKPVRQRRDKEDEEEDEADTIIQRTRGTARRGGY